VIAEELGEKAFASADVATRYPGFTRGEMSSSTLSLVLRCEIGRISFSDTGSVMHYRSGDGGGLLESGKLLVP